MKRPLLPRRTQRARVLSLLLGALLLSACGEKPETLLLSAQNYLEKKDAKAAIIQIKNVLQEVPDSAQARFLLGRALLEDGDILGSEAELRKALDLKHPRELVIPELAKNLLAQGQAQKLVDEFADLELHPPSAQASLLMSLTGAYTLLGQTEKAQASLNAALVAEPGFGPALLEQARQKAALREFDSALALTDEVIAKSPQSHEAWKLKGDIYLYGQNKPSLALTAFQKSVQIKPDYLLGQISLVTMLLRQGDLPAAQVQMEAMKKIAANHPRTQFLEAQLAFQKKDFKTARDLSQQVLKVTPKNIQALQLAGAAQFQLGDMPQAQAHLTHALDASPGLVLARRLLVTSYLRTGQPVRAKEVLQPALTSEALDPALLSVAGEVFLQTGDAKLAQTYFAQAAELAPKDAKKRTSLALAHLASGPAEPALEELRDIAVSDNSTAADMALVSVYLKRGELDNALKAIDGLEKKQPDKPLGAFLRAQTLLKKNDMAGARTHYERALTIDPTYLPAAINLAGLDLADKQPAKARQRFESVLIKDPKNLQALLALAQLAATTGEPKEEVARLLGNAIAANLTDEAPRLMLIDFHLRNKDFKSAVAAAQSASASLPESPAILDALGRTQQVSGELNQAIASYTKLIDLTPTSPRAYLRLAELHLLAKDKLAATASLRKALGIKPDSLDAQRALIAIQLEDKKYEDALGVARNVQKQRPKDAVGYVLEGDIHALQGKPDMAANALQTGLVQVKSSELALRLHSSLLASAKNAEAEKFAASWQKDNPNDAAFNFYLGDRAIARQDYASAEKHYTAVIKLQPNSAIAYNNLAWVSAKLGKPGAVGFAEKANALNPNQPAFMDTLAVLLSDRGDYAKALDLQTRALALQPTNAQFKLSLAKIHLKGGQKELARKELDDLHKLGDNFAAQAEVAALLKGL